MKKIVIAFSLLLSFKTFADTNCPNQIFSSISCSGNILQTQEHPPPGAIVDLSVSNRIGNSNNSRDNISTNTVSIRGNISIIPTDGGYSPNIVIYENNVNSIQNNAVYGLNYLNNNTIFSAINLTGNISIITNNLHRGFGVEIDNVNIIGQRYGSSNNVNNNINTISNIINLIGNISITGSGEESYGIRLTNSNVIGDYGSFNSTNTNHNNDTNIINLNGNISITTLSSYGISLINSSYIYYAYDSTGNTDTNNSKDTNIVNVMGRISVPISDLNSFAIYAQNDSSLSANIIQFNKGSSVIGQILGTGSYTNGNILKFNLGAGASYNFTAPGFLGNDLNGRPYLTDPAAAGIGNVATASQSAYERTTQISQSMDDRLRTYDLKQNTDQPYWINSYYSDSGRGGEGLLGSNLNFNQYRSGITAGFNLKNSYTPTELVVNYEYGRLNIDDGNQSIQSNSVMAGFLFPDINKVFGGTLSARAMLGYGNNNGNRKVLDNTNANGFYNVTSSYNTSQLLIGPSWTKTLFQTEKITFDTLLGLDLNTQHINSYSEGSQLFSWNARTFNQLQSRFQVGLQIQPHPDSFNFYGRFGIEHRDLIDGNTQNYAINNTPVNYIDPDQHTTYVTANLGMNYPLTKSIHAFAQTKYYATDKSIDSLTTSIGIAGQF